MYKSQKNTRAVSESRLQDKEKRKTIRKIVHSSIQVLSVEKISISLSFVEKNQLKNGNGKFTLVSENPDIRGIRS